jgi:hypothetical protein
MIRSSGGMGMHKHGVSGRSGPSPKYKLGRVLEANKLTQGEHAKRPKPKMFSSLADAMKALKR